MRLPSYWTALSILPCLVAEQKVTVDVAKPGLHDMLLKKMQDTASYLGFGVKCRNGGHKTEENTCICGKHFKGKECETRICINGGKLEKLTVPVIHHVCKCPHNSFITGEHCEKVKCANQGILRNYQNGSWSCDCEQTKFYGGIFCERFLISTKWIVGFICLAVFLIVLFICSSNWFSRRRNHNNHSNHHHYPNYHNQQNPRARRARSSSADDLIAPRAHRRVVAYPESAQRQMVVRLDTIPTFNPGMIGGVEPPSTREPPPTAVGPPPSYDQAMSSTRAEPPEYTPTDTAKINNT